MSGIYLIQGLRGVIVQGALGSNRDKGEAALERAPLIVCNSKFWSFTTIHGAAAARWEEFAMRRTAFADT